MRLALSAADVDVRADAGVRTAPPVESSGIEWVGSRCCWWFSGF